LEPVDITFTTGTTVGSSSTGRTELVLQDPRIVVGGTPLDIFSTVILLFTFRDFLKAELSTVLQAATEGMMDTGSLPTNPSKLVDESDCILSVAPTDATNVEFRGLTMTSDFS
jgi:hypothetical protein